ncbi:phospholipase D family protein [Streptococcus suis]|uniref:hypothetical protein n=1 Tax=Streptococcus suis TaxID=1307 RepID=UPI0037D7CD92
MNLFVQPNDGHFADILTDWLNDNDGEFIGISAFAKSAGILSLETALTSFRQRGGIVKLILGIDLDGTSVEALKNAYRLANELYIFHSENTVTFHPKIYILNTSTSSNVAVGSNNLTKGGLYSNVEATSIYEQVPPSSPLITKINDTVLHLTDVSISTVFRISTLSDIQDLENNGYVKSEKQIQINNFRNNGHNLQNNSQSNRGKFGKIPITRPTRPTSSSQQNNITVSSNSVINDKFWFETGSMTGGSRNILDLSKRGRIYRGSALNTIYHIDNQNVKGGVQFFGLDPDVPNTKNITLNYNGQNYSPATIKYAPGNQNWRLQIKGEDSNGTKITTIIGNDLVHKILLFEKVSDSDYILNIIPTSELNNMETISQFCANNGSGNGRKFGYILD